MSAIIKAARADAQRLLRYIREATTIDAERKLAAALLVKRDKGFRAAARRDRKWRLRGSQQESDRCVRQTQWGRRTTGASYPHWKAKSADSRGSCYPHFRPIPLNRRG